MRGLHRLATGGVSPRATATRWSASTRSPIPTPARSSSETSSGRRSSTLSASDASISRRRGSTRWCEECDPIFHLAAEPGVRTSWGDRFESYTRNNVLATQRLLEAAKRWPDKRVVFASSSSIYGDAELLPTPEEVLPRPFSPYGVTKLAAEHLCALYQGNYGVDTVALRYFSVYGPRQRPDMAFHRFCRAALRGEPLTIFGQVSRPRLYVRGRRHGRNEGRGDRASRSRPGLQRGRRIARERERRARAHRLFRRPPVRNTSPRVGKGGRRNTGADTSRARRELGFNPTTSVEAGLQAEFEWMRNQERDPIHASN